MHIEFLVEEYSAEIALDYILPKLLPPAVTYKIRSFQGKPNLLKQLPNRLRGYKNIPNYYVVVLVDRDNEACADVKDSLERIALGVGLATKSSAQPGESFKVLNRIAIEELEAWFFGDVTAMNTAYPRISSSLGQQARFRDPDNITGGTAEAFEQVLNAAGYHLGRLDKVKAAREIAPHMDPMINRSRSFQVFCEGLQSFSR